MFARKIVRTDGHFRLDGLDRRPWATPPFQGFDQLGLGMTDFSGPATPPFQGFDQLGLGMTDIS